MKKGIFDILKDLDLKKEKNRLNKIQKLSASDFSYFLDSIENTYSEPDEIVLSNRLKPFDIFLPFPSLETIESIPNYLFLFDHVYFMEPMYDVLSWLEMDDEHAMSYMMSLSEKIGNWDPSFRNKIQRLNGITWSNYISTLKSLLHNRLNKFISIMVSRKALFDENILIPFITSVRLKLVQNAATY